MRRRLAGLCTSGVGCCSLHSFLATLSLAAGAPLRLCVAARRGHAEFPVADCRGGKVASIAIWSDAPHRRFFWARLWPLSQLDVDDTCSAPELAFHRLCERPSPRAVVCEDVDVAEIC